MTISTYKWDRVQQEQYTSFSDFITGLGGAETSIVIAQDITISASLEIPANVHISAMLNGARFIIATGCTLTISGQYTAGDVYAFELQGTGSVTGLTHYTPKMFNDSDDHRFTISRHGSVTSYTIFDAYGFQRMHEDARAWRDELGDVLSLQQSGAGISINKDEGTVDFAYNAVYNATFTLADAFYKNTQLNHDRDESSVVAPHIHWFQSKNYAPNILLAYRWQVNGGAKVTSWTLALMNSLAHTYSSGTLDQISYCPVNITPPEGSTLSDIIQFRVFRDTTNVSGLFSGNCPYNTGGNASVQVLSFDTHIRLNSHGSFEEYVK